MYLKMKKVALIVALLLVLSTPPSRAQAAVQGGSVYFGLSAPVSVEPGDSLPVSVTISATSTPGNKGITGITARIVYSANAPVGISESGIIKSLPSPWNYLRVENTDLDNGGEILIEAIYLQPGETGDLSMVGSSKEFVKLNFETSKEGSLSVSFDSSKSTVRSKEGNIDLLNPQNLPSATYSIGHAMTQPTPTEVPTTPTPPPTVTQRLIGDADGDCDVDIDDFNNGLKKQFGATGSNLSADFNHDNKVNLLDFALLLINFLRRC